MQWQASAPSVADLIAGGAYPAPGSTPRGRVRTRDERSPDQEGGEADASSPAPGMSAEEENAERSASRVVRSGRVEKSVRGRLVRMLWEAAAAGQQVLIQHEAI